VSKSVQPSLSVEHWVRQIIGYRQDEGYREADCLCHGLLLCPFLPLSRGWAPWMMLVRLHVVATCVRPYNLLFHFQLRVYRVILNKQREYSGVGCLFRRSCRPCPRWAPALFNSFLLRTGYPNGVGSASHMVPSCRLRAPTR